jgi:DNA-binding PadR family transcriptional regulator
MELSPTAYVILGMLAWHPMSGYDVKAFADQSTRFFWATSYGQIYPELRRLAAAGLVEAEPPEGGGRGRKAYKLTDDGARVLREWLAQPPRPLEIRDEALLKVFFAGSAPETAVGALEGKRRDLEAKLTQLRALESSGKPSGYPAVVLRYGIELSEWMAAWCEREAGRLREEGAP